MLGRIEEKHLYFRLFLKFQGFTACIPTIAAPYNKTQIASAISGLFSFTPRSKTRFWDCYKIKKPNIVTILGFALSGERGIRTPGGVTLNSFQDCRIRPLCHFSKCLIRYSLNAAANIKTFFKFHRRFCIYFKTFFYPSSFLKFKCFF